MRTTVNIDDNTAAQLMQITGEKSYPAAIHHALEAYLKQTRKQQLLAMRGQVDIVANWQALREYELRDTDTANLLEPSQPGSKMQALLNSDFVGSGEGPEDFSTNYKAYLYWGLKDDLEQRTRKGSREKFLAALDKVPDTEPEE